jgi:YidC/Oxa1 family membrane protein insertase
MTDIRRTMLWVIFSMSLLLIWDGWNKYNGKPSLFSTVPPYSGANPESNTITGIPKSTPDATPNVAKMPKISVTTANSSQKIDVLTDIVKATIDSQGGTLSHVELLLQADTFDASKKVVVLDQSSERIYLAQTGLIGSMVNGLYPNHLTPMTMLPGETTLKDGASELQVKFESAEIDGIKLIKTYTFKRNDYVIGVKHEVVNNSSGILNPQIYFQLVRDGNTPAGESSLYFTFTGPAIYSDLAKFEKIDFKDIEKGKSNHAKNSDNGWVAMVQHYFASAWILGNDSSDRQYRDFFTKKIDSNKYAVGMIVPLGEIQVGSMKMHEARLFVGPQEENKLSLLAPGLELVKDYGLFTILSKPLFWLLTQLHKFLSNWGWSIVALVVVLKAAFFWLNAYAYRSMAKMKVVNPKIMVMRERLKDKPQQMQQEMMRLYKEEGVNPIGGCLPILLQMPFFIALYWVLLSSVEMRNAPWIAWITDLSAKDPYFILPLLMTLSSLLQTWLNPTPTDPMQARMMWIMPLVFSIMFFFFPAGLVLYWLTNNILSIAQQYIINKKLGVN